MKIGFTKAQFLKGHRTIAVIGGIAFLLFCISGVLHPVMSWTGPQAAVFRPPTTELSSKHVDQMAQVLKQYSLTNIVSAKVVPGPGEVLLQVTEQPTQARRYFNLESGSELANYDTTYALWLARYYLGDSEQQLQIQDIDFLTEFNHEYPSVNRLLPVYKVSFAEDRTSVFIYTELGALASLSNQYKARLQTVFRWLHTWSWLGDDSAPRFVVMCILVLSGLAMLISGGYLVFRFKRTRAVASQKLHRYIGAGLLVPLSFFVLSGLYHLIYTEISVPQQALKSPAAFDIRPSDFATASIPDDQAFSSLSLVKMDSIYLRLNRVTADQKNTRQARFKGMQSESPPLYINAKTGQLVDIAEEALARHYITEHMSEDRTLKQLDRITSFGPGYDFRNKRLPVWRGTLDNGDFLFVDNASGFRVDLTTKADQLERLSFSFLHKYNFLTPFTGRFVRDIVMVVLLGFTVLLVGLGGWRWRCHRQRTLKRP